MEPDTSIEATSQDSVGQVNSARRVGEVVAGVNWLWAIAGLTAISFLAQVSDWNFRMLVGMGAPAIASAVTEGMGVSAAIVSGVVSAGLLIGFAALSWMAKLGRRWAFLVAGIIYLLDAALLALLKDWPSVIFHGIALWFLLKAWMALGALREAGAEVVAPAGLESASPATQSSGQFLKLLAIAIGVFAITMALIVASVFLLP